MVSIIKVFPESRVRKLLTSCLIIKMEEEAPSSRFKLSDDLIFHKILTSPFHCSH